MNDIEIKEFDKNIRRKILEFIKSKNDSKEGEAVELFRRLASDARVHRRSKRSII